MTFQLYYKTCRVAILRGASQRFFCVVQLYFRAVETFARDVKQKLMRASESGVAIILIIS